MAKNTEKVTPAMKQFHRFKKQYPDAVLFFRMGDFYETFYEDAQICSSVLGLTLTSRSKGSNPIPLAGLPYHAVDNYLKKMIDAGYKVAVCEQVEDPKLAKGVVERDVVRIVTPGTLTDENLLTEKDDNFLAAVSLGAKSAAISWVDVSTGHFFVQEADEEKIIDELLRLSPRECLLPQMKGQLFEQDVKKLSTQIEQITNCSVTQRPGWYFEAAHARKTLLEHFGTATLEGFGISDSDEIISPAGAVIEYLKETQKTTLGHISSLQRVMQWKYLQIDAASIRSLEILATIRSHSRKGSLLENIDLTNTAMGARMLKAWVCMPCSDIGQIEARQDAIGELLSDPQTDSRLEKIRSMLKNICDLERIAARISTYRTNPKDLLGLADTLVKIRPLRSLLESSLSDLFKSLAKDCDTMDALADLLQAAIDPETPNHLRDGSVIASGFNEKLDHLRTISRDAKSWLAEYQQQQIKQTGLDNLKIGYNKVFGYYIEISRRDADKVPGDYTRKQTIKNAERYITEKLKEFEQQILTANDEAIALEQQLFAQLRDETAKYIPRIQQLAGCVAAVDCLASLAELAKKRNYIRPEITEGNEIIIREGRHPVLSENLGSEFVPNDVELDSQKQIAIITGPNMSGKSTYIRQSALLVILAQIGSYIPAQEAKIGLVDKIFTRVGASDELIRGQSTFMVEMTETANILNNATDRSLVILDEVGRGTSTYDGLALAWAISEHLAKNIRARTLFATHYHQLTELGRIFDNVINLNVAVREWMDEIVFLHKILPGGTDKSYGIHVAKLAGVPPKVISRARQILDDLEKTFADEAASENFTKQQTHSTQESLFVQKHKSVLDKLRQTDIDNLTPIQAINLLNEIKSEIGE